MAALREVLSSLPQLAHTRFGRYCRRRIPVDQVRRATLLLLCGYEVRLNGDTIELRASGWIPALMPRAEPVVSYLRKQCVLMPPPLAMDPDDDRFDGLFPDDDAV